MKMPFSIGKDMYERIIHPIKPLYDENSKILILGSFPSQKSRQQVFFYGHPQNRFWKLLALILDADVPTSVDEKKEFLLSHNIALWDVISSCDINGSSDSSIKNVVPNDLSVILDNADIKSIFTNGKAAQKFYDKYLKEKFGDAQCLPSTSPANAAWNIEKLYSEWKKILISLQQ